MTDNHRMLSGKTKAVLIFLVIAVWSCLIISGVTAAETGSAATEIAITSYQVNPEVFMQGDIGTLKITITNTGDQPASINRAELISDRLKVVNYQTYDKVGNLGPGNSLEFTFMLDAGQTDGTYFPIFYVDFTNDGSMRYPVPIKIDNTGIVASVINAPTSFSPGNKEDVTISIGNVRENEVNSVNIVPSGKGIRTTQSANFVGTLEPDERKDVTFEVIAEQPTEMVFDISWRNGPNEHFTTLNLPVAVGDRDVAADLVVNSIEITSGSYTTIKGDVTNAGLEDAKAVVVTPGKPAQPVDPNPVYVIGALKPDDFSSFEVTCVVQGGATTIPLDIEYRDADGNMFHKTVEVRLRSFGNSSAASGVGQSSFSGNNPARRAPGGFGSFGSGISRIPFLEIFIVIIIFIIGIVAWRKGYMVGIRDRFRKK